MWNLKFDDGALEDLVLLERQDVLRLKKKIDYFLASPDPLSFARKMVESDVGEYRWRIGDYRVLFDVDADKKLIFVTAIGHRKDVYRN